MNAIDVTIMKQYKNLGCIPDCKLDRKSELIRIIDAFNRFPGKFLRIFPAIELGLIVKLFNALCLSF